MNDEIKIKNIHAREILDSRGNPTIECEITLENGIKETSSVPSGASTGIYEAYELRDGDINRYNGKGVLKAVNNINTIINETLKGRNVFNQEELDLLLIHLDGTENKSNLGANAILATSLAICQAGAKASNLEIYEYLNKMNDNYQIPRPMMNIINGGQHALNNIDIQEFMIVPFSYSSFKEGLRKCVEVYHSLKKVLLERKISSLGVGDEGGFAPNLKKDEEALKIIIKAIEKANYVPGVDFKISLDVASSSWYDSKTEKYILTKSKKTYSRTQLIAYYKKLIKKYPIYSIEDGMEENDIEGWKLLTKKLGKKVLLVGDDLFTTNEKRLKMGIDNHLANSILIKPNQIGTISEVLKTIKTAKDNNYQIIISHRSGETSSSFISDLSVSVNAPLIKSGAPCRMERVIKYNRLLQIEEQIQK
ncbi:MAG: phosphopyruvate hydratase [Bacillales bacterium]|nr:phosphopyruvate hydratase [Bacillales bacterium]